MLKTGHHQIILSIILLVNIGLASWNFGLEQTFAKYLTTNVVALYDVRPVERMHSKFDDKSAFEPWAKNPYDNIGLTDLQLAKFHLGCYGTPSEIFLGPWSSQKNMTSWKGQSQGARASALTALQLAAGGFKERSVCRCIDRMLYSKMDSAKTATQMISILNATQEPTFIYNKEESVVNFYLEDEASLIRSTWTTKHSVDDRWHNAYAKDGADLYKNDITQFCMQNAMPQLQVTYEGSIFVNILFFTGILLILVNVMREFDYQLLGWFDNSTNEKTVDNKQFDTKGRKVNTKFTSSKFYWKLLAFAITVAASIVFVIFFLRDTRVNDEFKEITSRTTNETNPYSMVGVLFVVLYIIVGFVELLGLYFTNHDESYNNAFEEIHNFLIFTTGWLSVGISLLLQANYKHVNTVYSWVIIILGACLVQYVSNYFNSIYKTLFRFLTQVQGSMLATSAKLPGYSAEGKKQPSVMALLKFRALMQFIGWSRLLISITVILHIILIATLARESAVTSPVQSLNDGRLLYFALAFFIANCAFDLLYETLPFVFTDVHARLARLYAIYAYLLYLSITQLMQNITNVSHHWEKTLPGYVAPT